MTIVGDMVRHHGVIVGVVECRLEVSNRDVSPLALT